MMSDAWGWNGTTLFWAAVAAVAALPWLSVDAEDAPPRASPHGVETARTA